MTYQEELNKAADHIVKKFRRSYEGDMIDQEQIIELTEMAMWKCKSRRANLDLMDLLCVVENRLQEKN